MEQEKTPRVSDVDVPMKLTSQTRWTTYAFLAHVTWKVRAPGFLQLSPPLQKYISSYFFYLLYLLWGKKITPSQTRSSDNSYCVSPGAWGEGERLTLLLPLAPQKPGGGSLLSCCPPGQSPHSLADPFLVSPHRDVLHTDFLFYPLTFVWTKSGQGAPNLPSIGFLVTRFEFPLKCGHEEASC